MDNFEMYKHESFWIYQIVNYNFEKSMINGSCNRKRYMETEFRVPKNRGNTNLKKKLLFTSTLF